MTDLAQHIRDVPDFPKEGILFKDITTLLRNPQALNSTIQQFVDHYCNHKIDLIAAVEARGFILGSALAVALGAGFVPIRKPGKLPSTTHRVTYELEYGTDTLEIHQDAIEPGQRVLILDDLLATGGTTGAVIELLSHFECEIVGVGFMIELDFLNGRDKIKGQEIFSLIHYS